MASGRGWFFLGMDVTERKRIERELAETRKLKAAAN